MAERAYRSLSNNPTHNGDRNNNDTTSPRSSEDGRPVPRSPSMRVASPVVTHRHSSSFSDHLRGIPPSPRNSRQLSISSAGVQDLLNNPPKPEANPRFAGRDWHTITAGELVDIADVHFVEVDTGIEEATNILIDSGTAVLLIRSSPADKAAVATFDYKDLNQYLLFATGSLRPDADHLEFYQDLAKKAQSGQKIPLREAKSLGAKEPFVMLPHTAKLTKVVEAFGGGVHRLVVVKEWTNEVVGLLSQSHLVKFLWENGASFPVIDQLYPQPIKDLGVGSQTNLISINGDRPLREALLLMDMEGVSSIAVVDNNHNVVGNISTVDVKLLTKASSAPLLANTCIHFISVILSNRGMNDGKDSFPVFHISPYSTLAHTVAKLVATKSHRMWVTTPPSPAPSGPPTPSLPPHVPASPISTPASIHALPSPSPPPHPHPHQHPSAAATPPPSNPLGSALPPLSAAPSYAPSTPAAPPVVHGAIAMPTPLAPSVSSVSAAALPGAHLSGRLSGVVSLTDVLNLFARASGLHPEDLREVRRGRRRSSSSSLRGERMT